MGEEKPEIGKASVASREPRTSVVVGWNPELIRSAERQCAYGSYSLAADLAESMFSDERVAKCLRRLSSATALPLAFKLPGVDDEKSKDDPVCKALSVDFWKMLPESTLFKIVRWVGLFGLCLVHVDGWEIDAETRRVIPKLNIWHCRNLRNDPERGWQALVATGSSSFGEWIDITPGDGNWILFGSEDGYRVPLHSPFLGIARWYLLGKLFSPIDWASSSERHGQGTEYIENTLTGSQDADTGEPLGPAKRDDLAVKLSRRGRNCVAVLPRGWVSKLVTDGAKTYETFAKQTDYANAAIDIGIIGTNLTTEVSGGSLAAAQVHSSVDAFRMRSLLEMLATTIRDQLLVWWHRFNFGKGAVPYPQWDTTPPADKKTEAESRQADAQALKTYLEAGAQLNQNAWFEGRIELLSNATDEFPVRTNPTGSVVEPSPDDESQVAD